MLPEQMSPWHLPSVNPQSAGGEGGPNMPIENKKGYISATECLLDLKQGCKFKFVGCL